MQCDERRRRDLADLGIPAGTRPGRGDGPPAGVKAIRIFGTIALTFCVLASILAQPGPGLSGEELLVTFAIAGLVAGLVLGAPLVDLSDRAKVAALVVLVAASCALIVLQQEQSAAIGGIYTAVIFAAIRLPRAPAIAVAALAVGGSVATYAVAVPDSAGQVVAILTGVPPWFIVLRVLRQLRLRQIAALDLVDELQENRAAQAEAAALAERGRVARDMHDVLAHSLSALSLQLEGTRLLARDRGADPDIVDAVERAHHLAASGLDEARRAIGALRGEELPGPEGLPRLVEDFRAVSGAHVRLDVGGEPRDLPSEARLALYRTAQEALTNVRRHAAADRVDVVLHHLDDGVLLRVEDHGPGAPVALGPGGGYGLTGMRERAELLGGRLDAGPTADGFKVELWLPA
jgi:signal transduction histidine kinase